MECLIGEDVRRLVRLGRILDGEEEAAVPLALPRELGDERLGVLEGPGYLSRVERDEVVDTTSELVFEVTEVYVFCRWHQINILDSVRSRQEASINLPDLGVESASRLR